MPPPRPPVEFLTDRTVDISVARALATLEDASGRPTERLDARSLALRFFGEAALANVILLGAAWQSGRVPLSLNALERAFELNGVAVVANLKAFALGRVAAAAPDLLDRALPEAEAETAPDLDQRIRFLTAYQNAGWAARYRSMVEATAAREAEVSGAPGPLTDAVTRNLFKLMAYKDEYEVARLHTDPEFTTALRETFGEKIEIRHHFAPPLLPLGKDHRGYPKKRAFPPWVRRLLPLLAAMKRLRGTPFDPFGYTAERRAERAMIEAYATMLAEELPRLTAERLDAVTRLAGLPDAVRGFGPIKEKAMEEMHQHYAEILEELRQTERPQPQPEKAAAGGAVQ
jgi:indolepyruvate ferredoxin oxidoreductase